MIGKSISRTRIAAGVAIAFAAATLGLVKASDALASADSDASRTVMADSLDPGGSSPAAYAKTRSTQAPVVPGSCSAALAALGSGVIVAGASATSPQAGKPTAAKFVPVPRAEIAQAPVATRVAPKEGVRKPLRTTKPQPVSADAQKIWWAGKTSGKLNLTYAGSASCCEAIALLFDGDFETPDSANQNILVKDGKGRAVQGRWAVATNHRMLLFKAAPGIYAIDVRSGLADQGGRSISAASSGLVAVR